MRKEIEKKAERIKEFLQEHKVQDVVVMDLTPDCSWTDCFVVGTVTSLGHLKGVVHALQPRPEFPFAFPLPVREVQAGPLPKP